ncbi:MAG: helix-turn-helix transcriptional regulator [Clostridia bacterium]|jgi:transcriptional regulator with XRE-family HTH domain|nr:helix-turn-helix transcriptional regulator [Clostridia bacterium]
MWKYQRLRDLREDGDKTQTDIAGLLGVSRQQYGRWETGAQEIPLHHAVTLAKYYGISMDYICGITDTPKPISK